MKVMLLGMNSPTGRCLEYDNYGAGLNLFNYSGLSADDYEAAFERMNIIQGREWDDWLAEKNGERLFSRFVMQRRTVVVLGNKVWSSLGLRPIGWLCSVSPPRGVTKGATFYAVPHTSGRNLFYNDPNNRKRVGRLLRRLAGEVLEECRIKAS